MFCRMLSYQFFSPRPHKLNVDQIALFFPFPPLRSYCFPVTDKTFTGLDYEYDIRCLIRNKKCLPFAST